MARLAESIKTGQRIELSDDEADSEETELSGFFSGIRNQHLINGIW